jgi:anthranilate phosphoribosyltransferase
MKRFLAKVMGGERLTEEEACAAMGVIMDGDATPAQIGALLAALSVRGETEDEVVGFARAMRERAVPLRAQGAVDTCGTGGDGAVAKHGNRSASGSCGSADVLEALGMRIDAGPETAQRCFDEAGWSFLFAPAFHASTRHAVGPRRELGIRTAFNLLGPLTNPARPEVQVVGVPRPELTVFVARCLRRLGARRAWVVHGSGLDELTLCGPTEVAALEEGALRRFVVEPEDAGLRRCPPEAVKGGDARASADIATGILAGERGPRRDVVLLNAGAALLVSGRAGSLREGVAAAGEAVDRGGASGLLARVKEITRA